MAATIKAVNAQIAQHGIELVKGDGYFYFAILDGFPDDTFVPESVYVTRVRDLSLQAWVDAANEGRPLEPTAGETDMTDQTTEQTEEQAAEAAAAEAAKAAEAERKAAEKAEKEAAKAARAAEREAKKAEREAAKAEREAAREAKRQEREAAKAEREAAKAARVRQNGVLMPKTGTKCADAWTVFDDVSSAKGGPATIAEAIPLAEERGLNVGNVRAEYNSWRKFHGVPPQGRAPKAEAEPAPEGEEQQSDAA